MNLLEFVILIGRNVLDGLRRNKLPAGLSFIAIILSTTLLSTGEFDERPRFRKMALPQIAKAEQGFFAVMEEASLESNDLRRLQYFLEGHRRAKAALRVVREERPVSVAGRKAHRELLRYYELVDEQLAIIRTEMSFNESFDYIAEWSRRNSELMLIREQWLAWIQQPA